MAQPPLCHVAFRLFDRREKSPKEKRCKEDKQKLSCIMGWGCPLTFDKTRPRKNALSSVLCLRSLFYRCPVFTNH